MGKFLTPDLHLKTLPKAGMWELTRRLSYVDNKGIKHSVLKGTPTDLASIPRLLKPFLSVNGKSRRAAVLHDDLYENKYGTRKECDKLFYEALLACDVPKWQASIFYAGVRAGGWTRGSW